MLVKAFEPIYPLKLEAITAADVLCISENIPQYMQYYVTKKFK